MQLKETPKQYSARKLRVKIQAAKCAIMEIQLVINDDDFRLKTNGFQEQADCAFRVLDAAWNDANEASR